MKKINLGKKLALNKETIAKMNERQMQFIHGGQAAESSFDCTVSYVSCLTHCGGPTGSFGKPDEGAFGSCCDNSC